MDPAWVSLALGENMAKNKKALINGFALICILLSSLFLTSCASLMAGDDKKQSDDLRFAVETFNNAFRWGDYPTAAIWVDPSRKEQFWAEVDRFKSKIRIYEIQVRDIDKEEKSPVGTAILNVQYFRMDAPTLQSITLSQKWVFSEKDKSWRIDQSGFRPMWQSAF